MLPATIRTEADGAQSHEASAWARQISEHTGDVSQEAVRISAAFL